MKTGTVYGDFIKGYILKPTWPSIAQHADEDGIAKGEAMVKALPPGTPNNS